MTTLGWGILIFCTIILIFIATRKLPPALELTLCTTDSDCGEDSTCNNIGLCISAQFIIAATIAQDSATESVISGNNLYSAVAANKYMSTSQNYSQLLQSLLKLLQVISKYQAQSSLIGFSPNISLSAAINSLPTGQSLSLQAMPLPDLMAAVASDFKNDANVIEMQSLLTIFMNDVNNATLAANNLSLIIL